MARQKPSATLHAPSRQRPEKLTLKVDGSYRLTRLSDSQYDHLRTSSIAIEEISAYFEYQLSRSLKLGLGEIYTARGHC